MGIKEMLFAPAFWIFTGCFLNPILCQCLCTDSLQHKATENYQLGNCASRYFVSPDQSRYSLTFDSFGWDLLVTMNGQTYTFPVGQS